MLITLKADVFNISEAPPVCLPTRVSSIEFRRETDLRVLTLRSFRCSRKFNSNLPFLVRRHYENPSSYHNACGKGLSNFRRRERFCVKNDERCPNGKEHVWLPCVVLYRDKAPFPFLAIACELCGTPQFGWETFIGAAREKGDMERQREIASFLGISLDHIGTPLADELVMSRPSLN